MAKVKDICDAMVKIAPPHLAEDWDNTGLLVGDANAKVTRTIFCIDLTQAVLDEAIKQKAQMVIAYHPVIFKGVKRVTAQHSPVLYQAIRKNIAVYSPHTSLDVAAGGVNDFLAKAAGMEMSTAEPLESREIDGVCNLVVFMPANDRESVSQAAFEAGAGKIGEYDCCSFTAPGEGTFLPGQQTHPTIGHPGNFEKVPEVRLEMIVAREKLQAVCKAIRIAHSYEEPAIDIYPLASEPGRIGLGRVGDLKKAVKISTLISRLKKSLGVNRVLLAAAEDVDEIKRVAVGAGACGSMWRGALGRADVFVTGEMRHHDALAANAAGLSVICLCHSNSERAALPIIAEKLAIMCKNVKMLISQADKDPFEIC